MKLIDYIKGTRRGREANAIEREAMVDPFLADAIEGYESVYGSHSDVLVGLEEKIARRALRKRNVRSGGSRRWLMLSAAAALVVAVGGLAWYVYDGRQAVIDTGRVVAMETETVPESVFEIVPIDEGAASLADTLEAGEPQQEVVAEDRDRDQSVETIPQAEKQNTTVLAGTFDTVKNDVEIDTEFEFIEFDEDFTVHETDDRLVERESAKESTANIADALSGQVTGLQVMTDEAEDIIVEEYEPIRRADAMGEEATRAQAAPSDLPDMVVNEEFLRYFRENSILQVDSEGERTKGTVTVEFRVNDRGVPSAIQVISGFSVETNHEVIDLLVNGPLWTPTKGRRVRMTIEYR